MRNIALVGALALVAAAGSAQAAIDTASPAQIALGNFAVQTSETSFGGGNSLANAKAEIVGGNLNMLFGGRLNTGFERLMIMFDTKAGGANAPAFVDGANVGGMVLDAGFDADYAYILNGDGGTMYINRTTYDFAGNGAGNYVGQVGWANGGGDVPAGGSENGERASVNNQGAGLPFGFNFLDGAGLATAAGYNTGMGFSVPLSALDLGPAPSFFDVFVVILGGDGSTLSTQALGGVGNSIGGYGGIGGVNFNNIPGNQFFSVPTPGAAALLGLGGLLAGRRRR
ncbi:MAG: hypothetical protein ACKVS8_06475 [Phycisphaerales bacterium]